MFGIKADINEMSGFKSKIKKLVLEEKSKPKTVVLDAGEEIFEKDQEKDPDQMSAEQAAEMLQKASLGLMLRHWQEKKIFDLRVR